jgi:hypothetical protein
VKSGNKHVEIMFVIKGVLAELVDDSALTSDEKGLLRMAREAVHRGDLSDFIDAGEL